MEGESLASASNVAIDAVRSINDKVQAVADIGRDAPTSGGMNTARPHQDVEATSPPIGGVGGGGADVEQALDRKVSQVVAEVEILGQMVTLIEQRDALGEEAKQLKEDVARAAGDVGLDKQRYPNLAHARAQHAQLIRRIDQLDAEIEAMGQDQTFDEREASVRRGMGGLSEKQGKQLHQTLKGLVAKGGVKGKAVARGVGKLGMRIGRATLAGVVDAVKTGGRTTGKSITRAAILEATRVYREATGPASYER